MKPSQAIDSQSRRVSGFASAARVAHHAISAKNGAE